MFNTPGGFNQPTPNPNFNLISLLEKELQNIDQAYIEQLCRKIYPVEMSVTNPYNALYRTLINYFAIQVNKGCNYESISADVAKIASGISEALCIKVTELFKKEEVRRRLVDNMKKSFVNPAGSFASLPSLPAKNNVKGIATPSTLLQNLGNKYGNESGASKYGSLLNRQLNDTYRREQNTHVDPSASIAQKYMKDKTAVENLIERIKFERQLTDIGQLSSKRCLLCDNFLAANGELARNVFKCKDCGEMFHRKCMQRDNNCSFCQLERINPLQKVKAQLFIGLLKKGTKKHEIEFEVKKEHEEQSQESSKGKKPTTTMPTIELRCIRLKDKNDTVANFINLFPDACTITVNNRLLKEFQPLHKQSSLKYRRDECIRLSANINLGINKVVITERCLKKETKTDQRIDSENHVVGLYIVETLNVPKPANKLEQFLTKSGYLNGTSPASVDKFLISLDSKSTSFAESESLLRKSLFINTRDEEGAQEDGEEELACETVKAPLICSLTLQKMKYPGRSIFCKHFACFDVYNFILLNAQAKLPKWQCPICKASAYKFQIDCIMTSIIGELQKASEGKKQVKDNEEAAEVQFDLHFAIRFLNNDGKLLINKKGKARAGLDVMESEVLPSWVSDIYDLPIEGKSKREREVKQQRKSLHKMIQDNEDSLQQNLQAKSIVNQIQSLPNPKAVSQPSIQSAKPQQMPSEEQESIKQAQMNDHEDQRPEKHQIQDFKVVIEPFEKDRLDHEPHQSMGQQMRQKQNQKYTHNAVVAEKEQQVQEMQQENVELLPIQGPVMEQIMNAPSSLSDRMSPEDLEMERALKEYEEMRKLKNMMKSGAEPFSASYQSYKGGNTPPHQEEQPLLENKDEEQRENSMPHALNNFENLFMQSQDEKDKAIKTVGLPENSEIVNEKKEGDKKAAQPLMPQEQPQEYPKQKQKDNDNLFKGYATRNTSPQQKGIKRKIIPPPKKSSTVPTKTRNQKDKPKKGKEKDRGKEFELPEDADLIQLSD